MIYIFLFQPSNYQKRIKQEVKKFLFLNKNKKPWILNVNFTLYC